MRTVTIILTAVMVTALLVGGGEAMAIGAKPPPGEPTSGAGGVNGAAPMNGAGGVNAAAPATVPPPNATMPPANAPDAAADAAGPLAITATPDAATVQAGGTLKLDVVIKNVSKDAQSIDVPNLVWAAGTDTPQIRIPGWPLMAGRGPVVIFKAESIAPGGSYSRTWNAIVSPEAASGEIAFRVGVPLHRGADKTWSEPLKVKIVAKDAAEAPAKGGAKDAPKEAAKDAAVNPLYAAWKGQEGKSVTFTSTEARYGGAPMPRGGGAPPTTSTVKYALSQITPEQAVIKVTRDAGAAETLVIPAKLPAGDAAIPVAAGKEDLKVGDKTYSCTKYTYKTKSAAEMGRDGQGLAGRVTVWMADGVPGGIVQRQVNLTDRVTYVNTEILVPGK
jgi:hypothetical protein